MLKLVEFTKEGTIVVTLSRGPLTYSELKRATGLSDAWLSRKLKELTALA